ncbi:MAG: acetylglutamate kinase [Imperialibacter sp.]|uniref:acetylglutamate kinase n=1 Tax=Imperialibacter sp. TaxID=2038411 RepID=UPI0032EEBFA2
MKNLTVVKVGGGVLENEESSSQFLKAFTALEGNKLLVHGGGRLADQYLLKLGLKPNMVNGRRVTDKDTLEVVTMVYGGLVNKQLVANLQSRKVNAIGLTGADGNLIVSAKRPSDDGVDWGYVGDPVEVNADTLNDLVEQGTVPVIAPLTHDGKGTLLNTNADTMATVVSVALARHYEVTLIFAFDKAGVLTDVDDDNSVVEKIDEAGFAEMKASGQIHSGMIPKLESAFEALNEGIRKIRIVGFANISNEKAGTTLQLEK